MNVTPPDEHHDFSVRPPESLGHILGCSTAKVSILRILRHPGVPPKLFLTGPSGSGKTSLVRAAVELAACDSPSADAPCKSCPGCIAPHSKHHRGRPGAILDLRRPGAGRIIDYVAINCRNATVADVEARIDALRDRRRSLRIIHLEEAASLRQDRRDERLTDFMDDPDFASCRWLATAVVDDQLDEQFRRRWTVKVTTTRPTVDELADKLADRCNELGIEVEDARTWRLLAERSWGGRRVGQLAPGGGRRE